MQCPLCLDATLEPKYVGGTEVDICPKCRGIWLDRGELDRLLGDAPPGDDRRDDRSEPIRERRDERRDEAHRRDDDRGYDDRYDRDRGYDDRYDRERGYDDRYDRDRRPRGKKTKAKRLADLFEEVLDF